MFMNHRYNDHLQTNQCYTAKLNNITLLKEN